MAQRIVTQSCVLMCAGLLVMAEGSLHCCKSVLANGSSSVQLSEHPDPSCRIYVNADNVVVVDEQGQIDETRVLHYEPKTLTVLLRRANMSVELHIDCDQSKEGFVLSCSGLCVSSADATTAASAQETQNTASRISVSTVLILLLFIIIIISSSSWSY